MNSEEARSLFELNLNLTEEIIRNRCRKHSFDNDLTDEFCSFVYEKLIENDYKKIRDFKGKSSYKTYITVVISRIIIDKMRLWGRWKPSQKAIQMGREAEILEQLIFRDKYAFDHAYNTLITNHNIQIKRERAYEIVSLLQKEHVKRPKHKEVELDDYTSDKGNFAPDKVIIKNEISDKKHQLEKVIKEMINFLSNEERLILKMRFEDVYKVSEIAGILNKKRRYIEKKLRAILLKFKGEILSNGISIDDILDCS